MSSQAAPGGASLISQTSLLAANTNQIKTRDRVRDLAEVYTHEREVNAMLDLVLDMFPTENDPGNHDRTFLEPACGSGNFLEAILMRKLSTVTVSRYGRKERYEHRILRCVTSVYGIDIDRENVLEARDRLRAVISSHIKVGTRGQAPSVALANAVDAVLTTNIIWADTRADARSIQLVAYSPGRGGTFIREWSSLDEPAGQLHLFGTSSVDVQKDQVPIHYADLAANPKPTVAVRNR